MLGDHIRTLKAGRWTHAIDCGDETVILLAEDAEPPLRIRRSYRPEFVGGADTVEVVLHRERTFPAEEVVARAYSRISDPALASMFRNSEAFAEWCTTGRLPVLPPNVAVSVPGVAVRPAAAGKPSAKPAASAKPSAKTKRSAKSNASAKAKAKANGKPAARAKPAAKAKPVRTTKASAPPARRAAAKKPAGKARAPAARKPARAAQRGARR